MQQPASDRSMSFWGVLSLAGGTAMILASFGVIPFEPRAGEAPLWVLALAGGAFAMAGLVLLVQGAGRASPTTGELPPGSPLWMRLVQSALSLGVMTLLALVGSWVAFGAGERHFSTAGLVEGHVNEMVGRGVFAFGALIAWLCVALFAVGAVRRLRAGR